MNNASLCAFHTHHDFLFTSLLAIPLLICEFMLFTSSSAGSVSLILPPALCSDLSQCSCRVGTGDRVCGHGCLALCWKSTKMSLYSPLTTEGGGSQLHNAGNCWDDVQILTHLILQRNTLFSLFHKLVNKAKTGYTIGLNHPTYEFQSQDVKPGCVVLKDNGLVWSAPPLTSAKLTWAFQYNSLC